MPSLLLSSHVLQTFLSRLHYVSGPYDAKDGYKELQKKATELEAGGPGPAAPQATNAEVS